ncbi:DMT family transporter [Qipengyuania atrilutea]|uniref:DMT family transporter n=1 Tax=Qipengyuania atrilutea TaxID=2744473 RepID=A0A850H5J5_9SPHN|nr:DMT family transporter [Actirhodobacter atriluteus]NVD45123.1 DMT family transporter [Actirhodobacter atriluteus]
MKRDHPLMPMALTLAGVGLLALMDAFMKGAALAVGAYSASVLRVALSFVIATPLWLLLGAKWPERTVLRLHLARGVVSAFMGLTFFYALTKLPIAETIAISFVAPILALYLAAVFLGETIGPKAITAAVLGFAGTLVIVGGKIGRGNAGEETWLGLAAIFVSALLYAVNFILIRKQSLAAIPLEIAAFHGGVQALVLGVFAPFLLVLPDPAVWSDLGIAAVLTVAGALAIAWAYARAEAQVLIPLEYSGFLWAALFGWLFFREPVTATTLIGAGLIVIGCMIAARRRPEQTAL